MLPLRPQLQPLPPPLQRSRLWFDAGFAVAGLAAVVAALPVAAGPLEPAAGLVAAVVAVAGAAAVGTC